MQTQTTPRKPRTRKPYRTVRVFDKKASHGIDSRLVFEMYPNGLICIREHGRRVRREITAAALYEDLIKRDARKPKKGGR